jgi:hypothetical protein
MYCVPQSINGSQYKTQIIILVQKMAHYEKFDYYIQNLNKVGIRFGLVFKKLALFFAVVVILDSAL